MKSTKKVLVLTGGLGNQLFQLAAGLSTTDPENLVIDYHLGKPRLNRRGTPDLDSFSFPSQITFETLTSRNLFFSNFGSLAFKVSSKKFHGSLAQYIWLWLKNRFKIFSIFLSDGVGFDPRLNSKVNIKWIFGPFHTYKYLEQDSIRRFISAMVPREHPDWLRKLEIASVDEKPIILHIRLADYKNIEELGILGGAYFKNSLKLAINEFPNSRIWLFTDEEDLARKILGEIYSPEMRIINYDLSDSASNLEAMRFGHAYVLSNSTFSWWGAYLSKSPNPKVFCPDKWFKTKQNPLYMIPSEWEMVANS